MPKNTAPARLGFVRPADPRGLLSQAFQQLVACLTHLIVPNRAKLRKGTPIVPKFSDDFLARGEADRLQGIEGRMHFPVVVAERLYLSPVKSSPVPPALPQGRADFFQNANSSFTTSISSGPTLAPPARAIETT